MCVSVTLFLTYNHNLRRCRSNLAYGILASKRWSRAFNRTPRMLMRLRLLRGRGQVYNDAELLTYTSHAYINISTMYHDIMSMTVQTSSLHFRNTSFSSNLSVIPALFDFIISTLWLNALSTGAKLAGTHITRCKSAWCQHGKLATGIHVIKCCVMTWGQTVRGRGHDTYEAKAVAEASSHKTEAAFFGLDAEAATRT